MSDKIKIFCKKCSKYFEQYANNHLNKQFGCGVCAGNAILSNDDFISKAKNIHPDNRFDYSLTKYIRSNIPVKIQCNVTKLVFEQTPNSHLIGSECPCCKHKTELKLEQYLNNHHFTVTPQYKQDWCRSIETNYLLPFDFYLQDFNLIIELDGPHHFTQVSNWKEPIFNQQNDVYKMKKAMDKKISILRILQEDVWNNDEKWLDENLLPFIEKYEIPIVNYIERDNFYKFHKELMELETF
jgi:very-short-patch-repair endonuclease